MNSEAIKKAVRHYLYGLLASAWNGAIGAVAGILGIGAASIGGIPGVAVLDWPQMLSAFGGAFFLHAIMWLKAHPVPTELAATEPPFSEKNP
jgi:hypothetical protein